jgi:hypothetical protein
VSRRAQRRAAMANRSGCLFCGTAGGLTEEHIYPDWLRKLGFRGEGLREIVFDGDPTRSVLQKGGPFSKTLKIACTTCNGQWMSGMEQAAKPILIDLFTAQAPAALDQAKQLILARWAFKTVAVLSRIGRTNPFPASHCRDFHANDVPPAQTRIWIGAASITTHQLGEQLAESRFEPRLAHVTGGGKTIEVPAYSARFRILNVVFDVFGYTSDVVQLHPDPADDLRRALLPIWPSAHPTIWWPPPLSLDALGGVAGLSAVPMEGIPTLVRNDLADVGRPLPPHPSSR